MANFDVADVQMEQPLAIPEQLRQTPGSVIPDPVCAQINVQQHLALPQHHSQTPSSISTNA
eukprot:2404536-Rhodomonas_salina.1